MVFISKSTIRVTRIDMQCTRSRNLGGTTYIYKAHSHIDWSWGHDRSNDCIWYHNVTRNSDCQTKQIHSADQRQNTNTRTVLPHVRLKIGDRHKHSKL